MIINVTTREANNIEIYTKPTNKIRQIKNKIKKLLNIPVENQHLIFEGLTLKDEQTIQSYDLRNEAEILLANKDQSLLLKQPNLHNNSKLIDHIKQAINEISSADEGSIIFLLNEAISFLDDNLDQQTVKSLFSLILLCFEKFTDQSFEILDSRLQKKIVNSYHLILVAQILSYFAQTQKNKPTKDYDDFISKSFQDILEQKQTILQYHIPSQFKEDFITDIIILSEITEKVVTDFSKLFFTDKISFNKLNIFVNKVSKKNLLKLIPESVFIEKNLFLNFSPDIIIDFIDRSSNETFKKLSKSIEDSFTKKHQVNEKFSNIFLSKCIKLGIIPGKLNDLLRDFDFEKIEDTLFWEYIYKNNISIPKEAFEKFPYVDKLISIILKMPNLEDHSDLLEMFYKLLMKNTYISTNYILIHLEKITKGIRLDPKMIFENLNDLYKQYSEDFDVTLKNNYTFSESQKVFIRKLEPQNLIEKPDISFIKKLVQNKSFESLLLLQNIACSFPFLFDPDFSEIIENILPTLDCFDLFFQPQVNEEQINKLKKAASALAFLSACLYSTKFLSNFIDWIFDNLFKLKPSQFIFMSFILYSLFETKVVNKITLAMAIKYNFFEIVHYLLTADTIPNEPFESFYKRRIYELSLKYIELYMSFWDYDSYLFIDQIIKDSIKEPIKIEFNNFTIISNVIFQPLKILFHHKNGHIKEIMTLFEKIGAIRSYWVLYNTSSTNKPKDDTITKFLSKFKDRSFSNQSIRIPNFKLPKARTVIMERYLQTVPKWILGFIDYYDPNVGILNEYSEYLQKIYDEIKKISIQQNNNDNYDDAYDKDEEEEYSGYYINDKDEEEEYSDYGVNDKDEYFELYYPKKIYLYDYFYKKIRPWMIYKELLNDIRILPQIEDYIYAIIKKITQNKICAKKFLEKIYKSIPNTCKELINSEQMIYRLYLILRNNESLRDEKLIQILQSHLSYLKKNKDMLNKLVEAYDKYKKDKESKVRTNPASIIGILNLDQNMPKREQYQSDLSKCTDIDFMEPITSYDDNPYLLHVNKQLYKESLHWKFLYEDHRSVLIDMCKENENFTSTLNFFHDYFELIPYIKRLNNFNKKISKTNNYKTLNITRENILESIKELLNFEKADLLGNIIVKLEDDKSFDEENLYKEWFEYIIKYIFDTNNGFFIKTDKETYYPNPSNDKYEIYEVAGKLVALALIHGQYLSVHLSKSFLRQILHQKINFYDMEEFDESTFDKLKDILDSNYAGSKTFQINGNNIEVTNENKQACVSSLTLNILRKSMEKQINAFSQAFDSLIAIKDNCMFTPKELDSIIYGTERINLESFIKHAHCAKDDPTIEMFFKVISNWDQDYLSKLIRFITGSSRVPTDEFGEFDDKGYSITINVVEKAKDNEEEEMNTNLMDAEYPTADTYHNTLNLPKYDKEEEMNTKLMAAVNGYKNPFESP